MIKYSVLPGWLELERVRYAYARQERNKEEENVADSKSTFSPKPTFPVPRTRSRSLSFVPRMSQSIARSCSKSRNLRFSDWLELELNTLDSDFRLVRYES